MMPGFRANQRDAALLTQPGAVGSAHRRERQRHADRVDDRLLEVDGFEAAVATDARDLVGVGGLVGRAVG